MSKTSRTAGRTHAFGETIFSEFTALAQQHDALNLGQGFPDFDPPEFVLQAARDAVADAGQHQYARGAGLVELVEVLAAQLEPSLGRPVDPLAEVTITVGATEGLLAATLALVDPGDEVILLEPFYDAYPADVSIAGGRCRYVPLQPDTEDRFGLDPDELRRSFGPRTRAIFLNTPHNPTGKVFTRPELELVAELCLEHDVFAICDEVYERILFDGREHLHLAAIDGMADRTITISSAGKTFSVTGWKIGWVLACPHLSDGIRRIHQWIPFCVATPLQRAVSRVLLEARENGYDGWLRRMYQAKRDLLVNGLRSAGLAPLTPEGTYFVVADTSDYTGRSPSSFADDVAFCRHLTKAGVAAIPPGAFYCEAHRHLAARLARFCFCKEDATLEAAVARMARILSL